MILSRNYTIINVSPQRFIYGFAVILLNKS